jgi:hypothetical protein
MKNKFKISVLISVILVSVTQLATAQSITFQDSTENGKPDFADISMNFTKWGGKAEGRVFVYDQGQDMIESQNLENCCDFENDVWIFDAAGNGNAELIINFSKEGEKQVAYLYDDSTGDGKVSYNIEGTKVQITESPYWTLKVIAKDGFWNKGDKINYNLEFLGDGKVTTHNADAIFMDTIQNDGNIDFRIRIYDINKDSIPDFEFRQSFIPAEIITAKTLLTVNVNDSTFGIKEEGMLWHFLGSFQNRLKYSSNKWLRGYKRGPAPILVDLEKAKITSIVEMIPSRDGENNYFIYSHDEITEGETNEVSGEIPFAFYDLANDDDGLPELIIRMLDDYTNRFYEGPLEEVRYTWDQDNDNHADYRLAVIGDKTYDTVVNYPINFSIKHVSYEDAPNWIFNQPWTGVFFVSIENRPNPGMGEGIYENYMFHEIFRDKLRGKDVTLPNYIPLKFGERGEYTLNLNEPPKLYFSPIDGRLHLLKASGGVWVIATDEEFETATNYRFKREKLRTGNISTTEKIEYRNIDGGRYIDGWTYFLNDRPIKNLLYNKGFLIYSDEQKTKLIRTEINQSLFETTPPSNYEEWKELSNKLDKYGKNTDYKNFEETFNQFSGDLITIDGGALSDFEATEKDFRFVLECSKECSIDSSLEIVYEAPLDAGRYLFYYDGLFSITKLKESDLSIETKNIFLSKDAPVELEHITITAEIRSLGDIRIGPILVQFFDGDPELDGVPIANRTISSIDPEGKATTSVTWLPDIESETIYVKVDPFNSISEQNEKNNIALKPVKVLPAKRLTVLERFQMGSENIARIYASVLLLGMLFMTLYIAKTLIE